MKSSFKFKNIRRDSVNSETEGRAGISDEQIIEMYWQRDEAAIKETDKKYGKLLFKIAYNILHNRSDCEECRNDAYLGVWNAIPPTKPTAFLAFITQIMRRISIDRYKARASLKRVPSELTVSLEEISETFGGGGAEAQYEAEEVGRVISDYVRSLEDRQRYIFIDRFYFAEPVETIAKDLSIAAPTVYRDIDKIKKGLKAHLERNGVYI